MPGRTARLACSIALLLLAQGAARAAPLNWEGTFSIELLAGNPSFQVEGGGIASVNASSGGLPAHLATLRLPASRRREVGITQTGLVSGPSWLPPLFVTASLDPATFSAISGGAASTQPLGGRVLPLRGVFRFGGLLPPVIVSSMLVSTAPLTWPTVNGATAGAGVGGGYLSRMIYPFYVFTYSFFHYPTSESTGWGWTTTFNAFRQLSVQGAPWTLKTATVSALDPALYRWPADDPPPFAVVTATRRGFAHGPSSATTSTARPGAMFQMVTPMQVRVDDLQPSRGYYYRDGWTAGGFGVFTLRFIPEPGLGLLLAAGVAGLVAIGRQRVRK